MSMVAAARSTRQGRICHASPVCVYRMLPCLLVIAGALGVTSPAVSAARPSVDPSTLQPPPPPDARCTATGRYVICHTVIDFSAEAEPVTDLGLPCGTVYFTVTDVRHGLRFYEDGLLVRRHVTNPGGSSGFISLSPTGEGPRLQLAGHLNWWETFGVPGDPDSASESQHGLDIRLKSPDGRIVAIIAGRSDPEGAHTGVDRFVGDPAIAEAICAALTP
jgi:hypothetical protein